MTENRTSASEIEGRVSRLSELEELGWRTKLGLGSLHIISPGVADPRPWIEGLRSFVGDASVRVRADFGTASLEFAVGPSELHLVSSDGADPGEVFAPANHAMARAVWRGNLTRVFDLPGAEWTIWADTDLGGVDQNGKHRWVVVDSVDSLVAAVETCDFWALGELLPAGQQTIFVVRALPADAGLEAAGVRVVSADALTDLTLMTDPTDGAWRWPHQVMRKSPSPLSLVSRSEAQGLLVGLHTVLLNRAASLAWVALSSNADVVDGNLEVEFFGFQRTTFLVPPRGLVLSLEEASAALDLFQWATVSGGLDHQIAIRQIVSVNPQHAPWTRAADVIRAAEPVVVGLRSDAVAEAFKARREVEALAIASGLRSVETASSIARATVERTVALVIGAVGVFVAQSLNAITLELASNLRLLLALAFCSLAFWNVFVEGPLASLPIRTFKADLPRLAPLLSENERSSISSLQVIASANSRVTATRIVVPILFLGCASALIAVNCLA